MEQKLLFAVEELLKKAGEAIMEVYVGSNFNETQKADFSPVTRADYLSSKIINEGLTRLFPDIPVIDEENVIPDYSVRKNWPSFFLLDPMDGTKEFIKRNGEFCINLALLEKNFPVVSWIYQPVTRKGWSCIKGKGISEFGGKRITVTASDDPKIIRVISSRSHPSERTSKFIESLKVRYDVDVSQMGSALKQVTLALGEADLYLRGNGCSEWDTAAGHLMVEENNGKVLQWDLNSTLVYNKINLKNPPFIMLSKKCQNTDFLNFIRISLLYSN